MLRFQLRWNQTSVALLLIQSSGGRARYGQNSEELVTGLDKDRRGGAGVKSREGEESHFRYKHEQEEKIKSAQKLFRGTKPP